MRSQEDFEAVKRLLGTGLSDYEIARCTGVPRATVQAWRIRPYRLRRGVAPPPIDWRPADEWAYAYLLGLYIGDGHIVVGRGHSAVLRLSLDAGYAVILAAASDALSRVAVGASVRRYPRTGSIVLSVADSIWPVAFPQHGPGPKHRRPIRLTEWQRMLTARHPKALIRGLIHSDGSRVVNRFTVRLPKSGDRQYRYPRYFFTNVSADIRRIFCEHCELLGIRWSQSNAKNISVSDRASVAILDSFVGPKS